ncbi:MAG: hypothetical protein ABJE47_20655 [bacterium]
MRVMCIGRHQYLSEHLCRFFRDAGADCEPVVGKAAVADAARAFEPHLIVVESVLLNPTLLDEWSRDSVLGSTPVQAVSFSRRTDDERPPEESGVSGVVYLPSLSNEDARLLLAAARHQRGVDIPAGAGVSVARQVTAATY